MKKPSFPSSLRRAARICTVRGDPAGGGPAPAGLQHWSPCRRHRALLALLPLAAVVLGQIATACNSDTTGGIRTPSDGKLTSCNPVGAVNLNICRTAQCWGYVVSHWIFAGRTVNRDYVYGPGGWYDQGSMPDPNIGGGPDFTGCWVITSGHAVDQDLTVEAKGSIYVTDPATGQTTTTPLDLKVTYEIQESGCGPQSVCGTGGTECPLFNPGIPPLGGACVQNLIGPVVRWGLGGFAYQAGAGYLALNAQGTTACLSDPAALYVPYAKSGPNGTVDVVTNSNGVILQVMAPQGLVYVVVSNAYSYQLQMFYSQNVTPKGTNGLYGTNGAAFATWTVSNPNGSASTNQLVLSLSRPGIADPQYTYTYTNVNGVNQWQLTDSGGLRTIASWQTQTPDPTYGTVTNTFVQTLAGGSTVQMLQKTYASLGGTTVLVQQIDGSGSATNTTTQSYTAAGLVQRTDNPDGTWEYFLYDSMQRVTTKYSTYLNYNPPAAGVQPNPVVDLCRETDYYYTPQVPGDDSTAQPKVARLEVVSLPVIAGGTTNLQEVSRIYRSVPEGDEIDEYRCPLPGANWNAAGNLVTRTVTYWDQSNTNTYGRPRWQVFPDGTATIYTYQADTNRVLTNIIAQTGQPDSPINPTVIVNGTQTATALNSLGQVTLVTTQAITNGAAYMLLAQVTYTYSGTLQQDYTAVDLANRTNQYHFACCGLDNTVDADGVLTTYDYDLLRRQVASTVFRGGVTGVKTTNVLDAAGRVLVTQRIGTNGNIMTLSQNQYDSLGRPTAQTNALGGRITYTNVTINNQQCATNVNPDGGVRVEVHYRDGRLQSVSGTAVAPEQYQYGAEQDGVGGLWREFTLAIKPDANGGTNEWTKTYTDGAGRSYKTVYAGASNNPFSISYYNSNGQLTNQVDPDGISTLYAYNGRGEQVLSVLDLNQDYNIDFGGSDRIAFTTNDFVSDHGTNVRGTQTYAWSANGNASSNLISTVETSTDELKTWQTIWNNGIGVTSQSTTIYAGGGNRYATNTAPDNSYTVSAYQYVQLVSVTSYDSGNNQLSFTSYSYDAYGRRNIVTDGRNGATTLTFNNADLVQTSTTPAPGGGQTAQVTTTWYDTMLRATNIVQPDNTSVTNRYDVTGLLTNICGSRTYPVAYTFDAQGRMKTMTTWTNFAGRLGAATATWNYDVYRGSVTNKTYDGGTAGPTYTYTPAGRLQSRLWVRGTNTTYSYNNGGDLSAVAYNDGVTPGLTCGYDRRGRQTTNTLGGSIFTTRAYDDAGNLLTESYSGGPLDGLSVTNGFDQFLRRTNLSLLSPVSRLLSSGYGYDLASRLQTVTDGTNSATYIYLANSRLVSQILFTNGGVLRMTTTKQFDFLNRLTQISSVSSVQSVASFSYGYNSANQRTALTNADSSFWVYVYDSLGQVVSGRKYWSDGTPVAGQQFIYGFDDIGDRQFTGAGGDQYGANLRYANYTANNLDQYTSRTVPGAVDVLGSATNASTVTVNNNPTYRKGDYYRAQLPVNSSAGPVFQSVTNLAVLNQGTNPDILTNVTGNVFVPQNPENFTYDADGNLKTDGRWNYTWDGENRLVSMQALTSVPTAAKLKLDFTYDWQGRRIQKVVSTWNGSAYVPQSTNRFAYDAWNVVAILNPQSAVLDSFSWGLDLSGSMQGAGGVGGLVGVTYYGTQTTNCFAAYDGNGNVGALVNAADGKLLSQYEYGPFGEVIRATGPLAKANPFRFSTKFQDDETELLYYGYRYYNTSMGRWISRDPLETKSSGLADSALATLDAIRPSEAILEHGLPARGPVQVFVENNPIHQYDKLGMFSLCYQACTWALALGLDWGNAGGIVCCGGQKHICVWRTGMPIQNSKAIEIAKECVALHESTHYPFIVCPCSWGQPTRPPQSGGTDECTAYTLHLACLTWKQLRGACGGDRQCIKDVWVEINYTRSQRDIFCAGKK